MAETSTPPPAQDSKPQLPNPENPNSHPRKAESQSDSAPSQQPSLTPPPPPGPFGANPNSAPTLISPVAPSPQPVLINPYVPPPSLPSFRPAGAPAPISTPQFTPVPQNPNFPSYQPQGPGIPPPGVSSSPGMAAPHHMVPGGMYQVPPPGQPPNPLVRPPYVTMPNGYMPPGVPQGTIPPPGVPRYPYPTILRPAFPLRPPGTVGVVPQMSRPPMQVIRPPVFTSIVRPPIVPVIAPVEKPQTTVYVGKIATTVENDFMLSLLQFCGPVKSWKRPQDPSNGTPKAFGFCEFESAEGALRAVRLLSKLNIDGQELVLNVAKKKEISKPKEMKEKETKEGENTNVEKSEGDEKTEQLKPAEEESQEKNESGSKENDMATSGLVSDEEREADHEATEKITRSIEERLKNRPLPPPPPLPQKTDVTATSNSEGPAKSGDKDSDVDLKKDEKNDDEMTSETKASTRAGTESPERGRRYDSSKGRERDRERDQKREKERELERIERERERERSRREREREVEIQKAERLYKERVKEWEAREKEREYQRKYEKEREKDKERERKRLVQDQEDESDDDSKRRRRRSDIEDKRKRRQREREDDLADRLKEEEEIAEAKKKAEEDEERQKQLETEELHLQLPSAPFTNGKEKVLSPDTVSSEIEEKGPELIFNNYSGPTNDNGEGVAENGSNDESAMTISSTSDSMPGGNAVPAKKLGFGLSGSGKRTAVLSVFREEDEDDAHKDKKMRPLVPIDYSAEELQATLPTSGDTPPQTTASAAADVAKRASKDDRSEAERDRSRRTHDRSSHHEKSHTREHADKSRSSENKNVLDAKRLIDMIPKTKEELFSYDINWAIYDKHGLQDRMRPWIVKKITEFLGEEETTLVDYIVSSIHDHVKAPQMLELLQSILDEEAEMFVLKMWRMLIFEIKRVETGLASKAKA